MERVKLTITKEDGTVIEPDTFVIAFYPEEASAVYPDGQIVSRDYVDRPQVSFCLQRKCSSQESDALLTGCVQSITEAVAKDLFNDRNIARNN